MPTDLELIKQLEKEIGNKLSKTEDWGIEALLSLSYQVDSNRSVVRLALSRLRLKELPDTVSKFGKLVTLWLMDNSLSRLPPEIGQLTNLTSLYLNNSQLSKLPSEIGQLTNLTSLDLPGNQLSALPPEIKQLTNLTTLDLSGNQLSALPPEIKQLTNLTTLSLSGNQLSTLPPEITQLTNLTTLFLSRNQLSALPPEIARLVNLTRLALTSNRLGRLPAKITQLTNLTRLYLDGNPLKQPPVEIAVADDNIGRIRDYFEQLEAQGEDYVHEAKLILVGEPGAGKTSLARKLMDPSYQLSPAEEMTKGIHVERWHFPYSDGIPFQCNIWDFGGQDIMHATHRYFLTKRSLYVVVADNRKEDIDFYYWLNILELLTGKSPVLIVLNEKFKYKKYVPENIVKAFESVKKVLHVNLDGNVGLADLSNAIQQFMRDLPHVGNDPIPAKWVRIREELEAEEHNYITRDDYLKICRDNGVDNEERAGYISEFLHDLGVVLHFQEDRILANIVILNTRWATEAVYQILFDNTITGNGGRFGNSDLPRVWHEPHYRGKYNELLQLMLNFKICYEIGNTQKYIIPELLPEKSSADKNFWTPENLRKKGLLHFEYRYDFMPKGIISRLIVAMNKYIHEGQQWKSGVVLKHGDSLAEIIEYFDRRVLKIRIAGNDRLDALAVIRKEVKDLHDTFENLAVHEMVPCNCPECQKAEAPHFFDYDELIQYKREGEQYIKCRVGGIKDVNVLSLISDVFVKEEDRMNNERGKDRRIEVNPHIEVRVEGARADARAQSDASADVDVSVDIDVKVDLPAIQNDFAGLRQALADVDPKLAKELDRIEDSLDDVTPESDREKLAKPMNKMRRFLEKLADEDSDLHTAVKGAKKGIEMAQKVGKTYNKFAQWLALPQVPDLFLGGD